MPTVPDRHHQRPDGGRPQARRRFGQHFLESVWAEKVVAAAAPSAGDTFIEIGPGPGAITRPLTARARAVAAFEIDRYMVQHLDIERP